jgi:hypothetical protein
MALADMMAELRGSIPKLPFAYTKTLVNRAWKETREQNLWSFNLFESAWISPPMINAGTCSVLQGSTTVTFDPLLATPALIAGSTNYSLITQRQFRGGSLAGISQIYNIINWNPGTGVATLDRIYADGNIVNGAYSVYQVYYTPPMIDFLGWLSVRNMVMFLDMNITTTRAQIDEWDPQRSWYQFPTHVVPVSTDLRGAGTLTPSATLGYPLFELWGQPVNPFSYACYGMRRGTDLSAPTDTLPTQVPQELVMAKARYYAYEWAEANKDMSPRSQGPDFRFLMGQSEKVYQDLLKKYRRQDKEFVDNWFSIRYQGRFPFAYGYYNTLAGVAGPYTQM